MKNKAKQGALNDLLGLLMPSMLGEPKKKEEKSKKKEVKPLEAAEMLDEPGEIEEERPKSRPTSLSFTEISLATKQKPRANNSKKTRRPLGKGRE